jgi:hypothetical protein
MLKFSTHPSIGHWCVPRTESADDAAWLHRRLNLKNVINNMTQMIKRTIHGPLRRTDRYIRMFHRATADEIKLHWFNRAVEHDRKAADAARRLAEENKRVST